MLYGINPVQAALRHRRRQLRRLYVRAGEASPRVLEAVELAEAAGVETRPVESDELEKRAQSAQHQGLVLDCGELPKLSLKEWLATAPARTSLLALDQVEDPQNLGGLVRSAAFLGAGALLLHRSHRAPLGAVASRASAGTMESFPVVEVGNLANAFKQLQKEDFWILGSALGERAVDVTRYAPPARWVLVMGNEGRGLRRLTRDRCDVILSIERRGEVESLNVNVAAGILLAHLTAV